MRCRDTAAPTTASTYRTRILLSLKRARKRNLGGESPARASSPGGREANEREMDEDVVEGQGEEDEEEGEGREGKRRRRRRRRQKRKIARADGAKIVPLFAF